LRLTSPGVGLGIEFMARKGKNRTLGDPSLRLKCGYAQDDAKKSLWLPNKNLELFYDVGVEDALLFQIMRDGVLRQKRSLEADCGTDPTALWIRVRLRLAWRQGRDGLGPLACGKAAAAELQSEVGGLNLIELLDLAPGFVADGSGDVDF
jgi:hypothetical protein